MSDAKTQQIAVVNAAAMRVKEYLGIELGGRMVVRTHGGYEYPPSYLQHVTFGDDGRPVTLFLTSEPGADALPRVIPWVSVESFLPLRS